MSQSNAESDAFNSEVLVPSRLNLTQQVISLLRLPGYREAAEGRGAGDAWAVHCEFQQLIISRLVEWSK
jgi:hypothetical protein